MPLADLRARIRKDPLGVTLRNQLLANTAWLAGAWGQEHRLSDGAHNAAEIPMLTGRARWNGAAYVTEGFESSIGTLAAISTPATGTVKLDFTGLTFAPATLGTSKNQVAVIVSSSSETGLTQPVLAHADIDTLQNTVYVYLQTFAAGAWAAENANVDVAVYSVPIVPGQPLDLGAPALRGQGLFTSQWNKLVTGMTSVYARYKAFHDAVTGEHNSPHVAKAEGLIISNALDTGTNIATVTHLATGVYTVQYAKPLSTPTRVFPQLAMDTADPTVGRLVSNRIIVCPRSTQTSASATFLIWSFGDFGSHAGPGPYPYSWQLGDADFCFSAHGA